MAFKARAFFVNGYERIVEKKRFKLVIRTF